MPLAAQGTKKSHAFSLGVLSRVVEPIAALLTILAARLVVPMLPFLLSLAAGAMFYVCVEELIPESVDGGKKGVGALSFRARFLCHDDTRRRFRVKPKAVSRRKVTPF